MSQLAGFGVSPTSLEPTLGRPDADEIQDGLASEKWRVPDEL